MSGSEGGDEDGWVCSHDVDLEETGTVDGDEDREEAEAVSEPLCGSKSLPELGNAEGSALSSPSVRHMGRA